MATWVSGSSVVAVGVSAPRSRRVGAGQNYQRAGLGDGTEDAGDAEAIVAYCRPCFHAQSGLGPIQIGEFRPAHAAMRPLRTELRTELRNECRRKLERVEVSGDRSRNFVAMADTGDGALHVARAPDEAQGAVAVERRHRPSRMRVKVRLRLGYRRRIGAALTERLAHAAEHRVA